MGSTLTSMAMLPNEWCGVPPPAEGNTWVSHPVMVAVAMNFPFHQDLIYVTYEGLQQKHGPLLLYHSLILV